MNQKFCGLALFASLTLSMLFGQNAKAQETGRYDLCADTLGCEIGDGGGIATEGISLLEAKSNCELNIGQNPNLTITCCFNRVKFRQYIPSSATPFADNVLMAAINSRFAIRTQTERTAMFRSLKLVDEFAAVTYVYAPIGSETERSVPALAVQGLALVKAYKTAQVLDDPGRAMRYRNRIRTLATSIASNSNFADKFVPTVLKMSPPPYPSGHQNYKTQNTFGWGRFWPESEGASHVHNGGYTYFYDEPNCSVDQVGSLISRPYQEETFDTAYAVEFLVDAFQVLKPIDSASDSWYSAALRSLDTFLAKNGTSYKYADQFSVGSTSHLYLYKTTGACEKNYLIKNTNMLMGAAYDSASSVLRSYPSPVTLSESDLRGVADKILFANNNEISNKKNFGYYSYRHQVEGYGGPLKVIKANGHQTYDSVTGKINCRSTTCFLHLPIESLAYFNIGSSRNWFTGTPATSVVNYIDRMYAIQTEFERWVALTYVNPQVEIQSQALGYLCAMRNVTLPSSLAGKGYISIKQLCDSRTRSLISQIDANVAAGTNVKWNVMTAIAYLDVP